LSGQRDPESLRTDETATGRRAARARRRARHAAETAMSKTYFIETWGCQMNDLDTQRLSGNLKLRGWKRVDDEKDATLILLNTCSIREKAEQQAFCRLGELRELKKESGAQIGVAGCLAQQEGERILDRAPWVDFVM